MEILEKLFKISDIFSEIYIAPSSDLGNLKKGDVAFIGRTANYNGIQAEVSIDKSNIIQGGCLTVSMVGTNVAKFHNYDFACSQNILVLRNEYLNKHNSLYLVSVIDKYLVTKGYGYGHPVSLKRFKKDFLPLPVNLEGNPDYAYMEAFMKEKEKFKLDKYKKFISSKISKLKDCKDVDALKDKEWKEFFLNEIFKDIQRGKRLKKADHKKGRMPYVSSTAINNGVDGFVGNKEKVRIFSNCLTIANSGSVGATFYQPFKFVASDHVTQLNNDDFNEYVYKFLGTIVQRLSVKYSFNREINNKRIERERILLPVNKIGEPDYEYMEKYMKMVEYKKLSKYLAYKNM